MNLRIDSSDLRNALATVCDFAFRQGGKALLVGGCVRDSLLGSPVKDLDVEVYGIEPESLKTGLASLFRVDLIGEAFGVIKIHDLPVDISIPRRESKAGLGHKGFDVLSDPNMKIEEAASRRDFTINSMAYDHRTDRLYDYFGGERDLRDRVLRHTSAKFIEDPLRVLRGMQFAARFRLHAAPETISLCAAMDAEGLAKERIFEEWRKLLLMGIEPSLGFTFLRDSRWVRYYPELAVLIGCAQDPGWHPEGDVWAHTLLCMDAFAKDRSGVAEEDLIVGFAVLCHDFGKPLTTEHGSDRIRSLGHAEAGVEPARSFLSRLTDQADLVAAVLPLVRDHLRPKELFDMGASASAVRRLACRVKRIDRLVRVARADRDGRNDDPSHDFPAGTWLLKQASDLAVRDSAPVPIVMGRHLIDLGMTPGREFKPVLDACYEAQLDGRIGTLEEGIALAKSLVQGQATDNAKGCAKG